MAANFKDFRPQVLAVRDELGKIYKSYHDIDTKFLKCNRRNLQFQKKSELISMIEEILDANIDTTSKLENLLNQYLLLCKKFNF